MPLLRLSDFETFDGPVKRTGPLPNRDGFISSAKRSGAAMIGGLGELYADVTQDPEHENALTRFDDRVQANNPSEINSLEDIADNPWLATRVAAGNAVGFLGPGLIGKGLGYAGQGLKMARVARAGEAINSFGAQTALAGLPSLRSIGQDQRESGEAPNDLLKYAAAGTVGAVENLFGVQKLLGLGQLGRGVVRDAERAAVDEFGKTPWRTAGKTFLKTAAGEGGEELLQSPIEQFAGYKDPTSAKSMEETVFGGAMGAIGGGVFGLAGGGRRGLRHAAMRNELQQDMFIAPDAGTPTDLLQGMDRREQYNQVQGAWQAQKDFDRPAPAQQPDEETAAYLEQRQQTAQTDAAKQTLRDNLVSKGVDPAKIEGIVLAAFQPKRTKAAATYTEEQQAIYESLPDTMTDKQKRRIVGKPGVVPVPSVSKVGKIEAKVMKEFDDYIAAGLITPNEESTLRGYWDASEKKQGDAWKLRANIGALIKAKQGAKNGDGSQSVLPGGTPTNQAQIVPGGQAPSGGAQTAQAVSGAQGQEVNDDPARALGLKLLADMPVGKKNRQGKTEPVKFGPVLATFLGFDGQDDEKFQAVADAHGYASRQRAEQIVKEAILMLREVAARNGITVEQAIAAVQALAASRRTDLGMTEDQQEIAKLTGATEQAVESPYQGTMDFKDAESQGMLSRGLRAQTDSGATQVGEGSDETKSGAPGKGTVADLKAEQELDAATTVETAPGETRINANKEKGEQYLTDNEIKAKRAADAQGKALAKADATRLSDAQEKEDKAAVKEGRAPVKLALGDLDAPVERGQQGKVKYKHNEFEYASAKEDYNDVLNEWIKNGEEVTQWDALPQEYKDRITQAWKDATNPNVNGQLRGRVDLEALTAEYKRLEEDYINAKTKSDKQDAQQGAEAEAESRVQDDNAGVPKQEVAPKSVAAPKGQVQEVTASAVMRSKGYKKTDDGFEFGDQSIGLHSANIILHSNAEYETGMSIVFRGEATRSNERGPEFIEKLKIPAEFKDVLRRYAKGLIDKNRAKQEIDTAMTNLAARSAAAQNNNAALESSPTKIERKAPVPLPPAEAPPKAVQAKATSVARTAKAAKPKSLTKEQKAAAGKVALESSPTKEEKMEEAWNDLAGENNFPVWSALTQDQRTRLMEDATPNSEGNAVRAVVAELTGETQEAPAPTVPALELPAIDVDFIDVTDEEVAKATNLLPQLEGALDKTLDENDKQEVTDHFGVEEEFGNATKKLFLKEYAKWLTSTNRALHALADIFVKVAKAAVNSVLAIAIAFNFTATNPIPEANASVPVTQFSVTQVVKHARADLKGTEASIDVLLAADWQLSKAHGKPYMIADKVGGLVYAFNGKGELLAKAPALYGADVGDTEINTTGGIEDTKKGEKITPAGEFQSKMDYGANITFVRGQKYTIAVHRVYLGTPSEKRMDRLNSATGADNRVSYGCINVTGEFFNDVLSQHFAGDSVVVVLPETKSVADQFPDINIKRTETKTVEIGGKQDSAKEVSWGSDKYGRPEQRKASRSRARVTMDGSFLEPNDDVMHKDGRVGRVVSTRYRNPKINGLNTITVKFADGTTEGVTPDKLTYLRKASVKFDGRKGTFGNESVNGGLRKITKEDDIALEFDDRVGSVMVTGIDRISGGMSGRASNALKSLTDWADSTNNTLVLMPSASGALKQGDLKAWYSRNGFVSAPDGAMVRKTDAQGTLFSKSTLSDDQPNPVHVRYAISTAFGFVRRASDANEIRFISDAGVAAERGKTQIAEEYTDGALEAFTKYIDKARKTASEYTEAQEAFARLDDSIAAVMSALQKAKAEPTKANTEKAADALRSLNATATEVDNKFSKGAPAKGSTVAELTTLLKGYFHAPAFFNRMVEVVQSSKDLPAAVRNDPEFDNTVKAVVHNGKAYIIADKVTANEALSILLHEVGVHLGMKKLLGGNYTRLIAQLKKWESKPGSLEHDLVKKARARVNAAGTSAIDQDHELVAYFVEEAVNAGVNPTDLAKAKGPVAEWIASLMKTVMAALKSMGMKNLDKLTAQDIVDLAYGAAYIQLSSDAQPSTKGNNLFSKAAEKRAETWRHVNNAIVTHDWSEAINLNPDFTVGQRKILHAVAWGDTDTALREITRQGSPMHKLIARLLLAKNIRPSVTFDYNLSGAGGSYSPRTDTVSVTGNDFLEYTPDQPLTNNALHSMLLHEVVHAGTVNSIAQAWVIYRKVNAGKALTRRDKNFEKTNDYKVAVQLLDLFRFLKHHPKIAPEYGGVNEMEMVAEALSNRKFQNLLMQIEVPAEFKTTRALNVYTWLVDQIKKLMGLAAVPNNAFYEILNVSTALLKERERGDELTANYEPAYTSELRDHSKYMNFNWAGYGKFGVNSPARGTQSGVLYSKGRADTIPKAVEFTNDTVANMLSRVKVTAADLGSKALNAAVFMNDLIKIAEKAGLTAAKGFNDLMGEKDQIRNRGEERISAIMSRASKLKDQPAVEQFLRDSTLAKKYGYGPKSDNGEFARRFTQLSAEGQAVVKDVFQVGEDNYTEMQRLAAVEVNREYNALIARSPKKTAELEKERTKELARMARVMPKLDGPYAPLKRFGDHVVVARSNEYAQAEAAGDRKKMDALIASPNDNNYLVEFYDTAGAADARKAQLVSYFDKVVSSNRQENFHKVDGLPWSGIEKIKSAVEDSPDTKYKAAMNKLLTNLYLKMMAESSARKSELKRRGVLGSGDMFRAFAANGRSNAHFIASMAKNPEIGRKIADMRQESKALREGGNVDATRAMNEILARYAQGLEYKETPWVDKALRVSSLWMLLTSPAYYLQNSTQTYMMTLPVLGGRYGGRAFTEITKAYGDVMKHIGNMGAELDVRKLPITKAEQDMLISLRDKGKLDITIASDMGRWASGAADQGVVGRAIDKMYGAAGKVEALNRITTALAAYRLSNGNEQYAGEIIDMTQGNYAATNAPRFFSATGATKLITQFRKYQLIQISLMGRLMYDAFKGASAEEKAFARRSLLWLFAQQGLLTGLKGLPIPAVIYMIAAALGGDDDDDWERNLRKWIGDEDIATLLIRGIPAYMGLDLSGRIGMGNAFSILPYSDIDFSKKGYKEAVFGATGAFIGGMGGQLFDGLEKMGKGNYYKGLEALAPRGLRDAMAGYRMGTEGVTSGRGDLLLSADEITAFDAAMKAVGLPTTRITEFQTSRGDLFELNNHFKERETALKNDYADAAKQRDSDAMSEAREEWKAIQASKGRWLAYLAGRGLGNKDLTKDLQPHPLGTLLKAPAAQMKRERPWQGAAAQRQAQ